MGIPFVKLHSCGNSCLCISAEDLCGHPLSLEEFAKKILSPSFGIGADNLILYRSGEGVDYHLEGFNSDGSLVGMCGNGVRCAHFLLAEMGAKFEHPMELHFELEGRLITAKSVDSKLVAVELGTPSYSPSDVPYDPSILTPIPGNELRRTINLDEQNTECVPLSIGNPHCVFFVQDFSADNIERVGPQVEHHRGFPQKTNVEFVKIVSAEKLEVKFWERAVGITTSSGSGSCAAAAATMVVNPDMAKHLKLSVPGGEVEVKLSPVTGALTVLAPVELVCRGEIEL